MQAILMAVVSTFLAALPNVLMKLVTPFITEKMMVSIAEKVLGETLKKLATLTATKSDDEAVQFIIDTWKAQNAVSNHG